MRRTFVVGAVSLHHALFRLLQHCLLLQLPLLLLRRLLLLHHQRQQQRLQQLLAYCLLQGQRMKMAHCRLLAHCLLQEQRIKQLQAVGLQLYYLFHPQHKVLASNLFDSNEKSDFLQ